MAGVVGGASGSGRRKSLDAEINLVSFIDLLSMCICFLLMTAVWLEVGSLQVKQSHGTDAAPSPAQSQELTLKVVSATQAELILKKGGKPVQKASIKADSATALAKQLDQNVGGWIRGGAAISAAMIETTSAVTYGDLVQVMDSLRRNQVVNLGVVPATRESAMGSVR
jgi:biopolymer transport protein TolR